MSDVRRRQLGLRRRRRRLAVEPLEARSLLAVVHWIGGDGDWSDPQNWEGGELPAAADDVVLDTPALVTHSTGSHVVHRLSISGPFRLTGGVLTVTDVVGTQGDGTFELTRGRLSQALVQTGTTIVSNTLATNSPGTLENVRLAGSLTLDDANMSIVGGLTLAGGAVELRNTSALQFAPAAPLAGTGAVRFVGTSISDTLQVDRIDAGVLVHGSVGRILAASLGGPGTVNFGTISADEPGGSIAVSQNDWTNAGVIEARAGAQVHLDGTWTNSGVIQAESNSTVIIAGTLDTDDLGVIRNHGGSIDLAASVDNANRTLRLDDATGSWRLQRGRILGGAVTTAGAAKLLIGNVTGGELFQALLDGVRFSGVMDLSVDENANVRIVHGLTLDDARIDVGRGGYLQLQGNQTLGGAGTIHFVDANVGNALSVDVASAVTLGPQIVIHGRAGIIGSPLAYDSSLVVQGRIAADEAGGEIVVRSANWTNQGVVESSGGGALRLQGAFTTVSGGLRNQGGTLNLAGTLDNTAQTLTLAGAGGSMRLDGGQIIRGVVATSLGASLTASSSPFNRLDHVRFAGTLDLTQESSNRVAVVGDLTLDGGLVRIGRGGELRFDGSQTLGGAGEIVFADAFSSNSITQNGAGTLTFGSGVTIHGHSGAVGDVSLVGRFVNRGRIVADTAGGLVQLLGASWTNEGAVEASNGGVLRERNTTNFAAGTLTGGAWRATGGGSLELYEADVVTNAADITLDGPTSALVAHGAVRRDALAGWRTNAVGARLRLDHGAVRSAAASLTNLGTIELGVAARLDVATDFTAGGDSRLRIEIGGEPDDVLFGRLAVNRHAELAGALDVALVDGFTPEVGLTYDAATFLDHTGDFATTSLAPGLSATVDDARVRIAAIVPAPDLAPVSLTTPGTLVVGADTTFSYVVRNLTGTAAVGTWIDSLYLSVDDVLDPSDVLVGRTTHAGGVAANGQYDETFVAAVPPVLDGAYHVLVLVDGRRAEPDRQRANNVRATSAPIPTSVPELRWNEPSSGVIRSNQDRYFRFVAPATEDVELRADFAVAPSAEVLIARGRLPTDDDYDVAASEALSLHQTATLRAPSNEPYFVRIRGREGSGNGQPFTLAAGPRPEGVRAVAPGRGSNVGLATLTLTGAGLTAEMTAALEPIGGGGAARPALEMAYQDSTKSLATFDLRGLAVGAYQVRIVDGATSYLAPGGFQVTEAPAARASLYLTAPDRFRPQRPSFVTVTYVNESDAEIPAPLLRLSTTSGQLRFPGDSTFRGSQLLVLGVGSQGAAGRLAPGERGSLTIEFQANDPTTFQLFYAGHENDAVDWQAFRDELLPPELSSEASDALWSSLIPQLGQTVGQWQAMLDDFATHLGRLGQATPDVGRLLTLALNQAAGLTDTVRTLAPTLAAATSGTASSLADAARLLAFDAIDSSLEAPILPLDFRRTYSAGVVGRYRLGALGRGWRHAWETSASADPAGNLTIESLDKERLFVRNADGSYRAADDGATLSTLAGSYRLRTPDGTVTTLGTDGRFLSVVDARGASIIATYAGERLTSLTHSNGASLTLTYDAFGRLLQLVESTGRVVRFEYDSTHEHLLRAIRPEGVTNYAYDVGAAPATRHLLVSTTSSDGPARTFDYDAAGRLTRAASGGRTTVRYEYPGPGRVRVLDGANVAVELQFDADGRIGQVIDSTGRAGVYRYDAAGRVASIESTELGTMRIQYDARGDATSVLDAAAGRWLTTYDATFGSVSSLVDPLGHTTTFDYDAHGSLQTVRYADGSEEQYRFDSAGRLARHVNRRGRPTDYEYDLAGRLLRSTYADGSQIMRTYDAAGDLLSVTTPTGTTTYAYDAARRLTQVVAPSGRSLAIEYDATGARSRLSNDRGWTVVYTYDAQGRLTSLADAVGRPLVAYAYDGSSRLARETQGNGTATAYSYDAAGRIARLTYLAADGATRGYVDYVYDAAGRLARRTDGTNTTSYDYDSFGQLVAVTSPDGAVTEFRYDAAGNRIATIENSVSTVVTVNALNQSTAAGATTYTYDLDGNLTSRTDSTGVTTLDYDDDNQLIAIDGPDGSWRYEYDGLGHRVATIHDGQRTDYLLDPNGLGWVISATDASGDVRSHYAYGLGLASRGDAQGVLSFYDFDAIGNVVGVTSADGARTTSYEYAPFGARTSTGAATDDLFTFGGRSGVQSDGGGLYSLRAREYDPVLGKFLQRDPLGYLGGDTNLYRYAGNDPLTRSDPSGLGGVDPRTCSALHGSVVSLFGVDSCVFPVEDANECKSYGGIDLGPNFGPTKVTHECKLPLDDSPAPKPPAPPKPSPRPPAPAPKPPDEPHDPPVICTGKESRICQPVACTPPVFGETQICEPFDPGPDAPSRPIRANDPNGIDGPAGFGDANFLPTESPLPFWIHFENQANATAAAQVVEITQQLDADLDWSSLRFGAYGFGPYDAGVVGAGVLGAAADAAATRSIHARIDARGTTGLLVDVDASIDLTTGLVRWRFTSLDPTTLDAPFDPDAGFLPPNDAENSGQGYVSYVVRTRAAAPTGTRIDAQATITFDVEPPLDTNRLEYVLDAAGPQAAATQFASVTSYLPTTQAILTWTGADDALGAGIASFDVYRARNGGAFEPLRLGTSDLSTSVTFQRGQRYEFAVRARDLVGHVQPFFGRADVTIDYVGPPWNNPRIARDVNDDGTVAPIDALLVINELNDPHLTTAGGRLPLPPPSAGLQSPFLDVDGDNFVAPRDALLVINQLNETVQAEGEEIASTEFATPAISFVVSATSFGLAPAADFGPTTFDDVANERRTGNASSSGFVMAERVERALPRTSDANATSATTPEKIETRRATRRSAVDKYFAELGMQELKHFEAGR